MRINHFFFLFLLLALAGCAGTPKWSDEEIAGIYVFGEVWQPGASGFLRPFLEVDGKGKWITVETDSGRVWSSGWTREGNRLLLASPEEFPAEIRVERADDGLPMLRVELNRILWGFRKVDSIGRKVGEPVPPAWEVSVENPALLPEEDLRILTETLQNTLSVEIWFRRVEFLNRDRKQLRVYDVKGSLSPVRRDPAIIPPLQLTSSPSGRFLLETSDPDLLIAIYAD